jgi:hypothetical protein
MQVVGEQPTVSGFGAALHKGSLQVFDPVKYLFQRLVERPRNTECYLQARRIFSLFDRGDRLARDANLVTQIALCNLAGQKAERLYVIIEGEQSHRSIAPAIEIEL